MTEHVTKSHKELDRLQMMTRIAEKRLTRTRAAELLGMSERQVRSLAPGRTGQPVRGFRGGLLPLDHRCIACRPSHDPAEVLPRKHDKFANRQVGRERFSCDTVQNREAAAESRDRPNESSGHNFPDLDPPRLLWRGQRWDG